MLLSTVRLDTMSSENSSRTVQASHGIRLIFAEHPPHSESWEQTYNDIPAFGLDIRREEENATWGITFLHEMGNSRIVPAMLPEGNIEIRLPSLALLYFRVHIAIKSKGSSECFSP